MLVQRDLLRTHAKGHKHSQYQQLYNLVVLVRLCHCIHMVIVVTQSSLSRKLRQLCGPIGYLRAAVKAINVMNVPLITPHNYNNVTIGESLGIMPPPPPMVGVYDQQRFQYHTAMYYDEHDDITSAQCIWSVVVFNMILTLQHPPNTPLLGTDHKTQFPSKDQTGIPPITLASITSNDFVNI